MTPYPGGMSVTPGTVTPGFATSTRIDLNQIGEARNSMLSIKLDQVSPSIIGVHVYMYCTYTMYTSSCESNIPSIH